MNKSLFCQFIFGKLYKRLSLSIAV